MMNFTILQHVPYETPGYILDWITSKGYYRQEVNFYNHPELPGVGKTENLIVMGGPMNIYDDEEYSWLPDERDFIKQCISTGKKILGICLGSQLIADALGAKVKKNEHSEIGWFKVRIDQKHLPEKYMDVFPDEFMTFHWHGDTFEVPINSKKFISSEATFNQAFISQNIAGFQFHPEMKPEGIKALIEHNENLFNEVLPFVQNPEEIIKSNGSFELNKSILFNFLDRFFG